VAQTVIMTDVSVGMSGAKGPIESALLESKVLEAKMLEAKVLESNENSESSAIPDLRLLRSANGVDARVSLWTCFYRFVIGVHHAEMIKKDFPTKAAFAQWAKAANLAFHLPRGYSLGGGKSPRKYYRALTQFWRWYQLLLGSSSAIVVRAGRAQGHQSVTWRQQFLARRRPERRAV
jgi:hypothetical protein